MHRLKIDDLQKLCDEREEESLRLEFKSCSELKAGSNFRDKSGNYRTRSRDDVIDELTKDVTAFLNSAGGTIIYGIQEKKSRASQLDEDNFFKSDNGRDNLQPEKIIDWLRAHIQPSPSVDVYSISVIPDDPDSPWCLVIEIPQGQQAYMAKNHRFYKRVGNTAQVMEQYEVVDVMNRTRGAILDLQIQIRQLPSNPSTWERIRLGVNVTSTNYVASEYGALKLVAAYPIKLINQFTEEVFRGSHFDPDTRLVLQSDNYAPYAQSIMIRWGAHTGNIVFPGDWYNFQRNSVLIEVPNLLTLPNPTYLMLAELFTINNQKRQLLYSINQGGKEGEVTLSIVEPSVYIKTKDRFWETYHLARDKGLKV